MDKENGGILRESEGTAMVVGTIIGVGILALPNVAAKAGRQDSYISVILGGIYPLALALLSIYFGKNHPKEDILILSKKYLGKFIGNICNLIFMAQFVIYFIVIASGLSNVFLIYVTPFLTRVKILIPAILLSIYLSNKGIKVLGRINTIVLYLTIVLILTLLPSIKYGSYLNLMPIFTAGYKNILKGSISTINAYGGMEIIFLIYPFFINKDRIKAISLKASFIVIGVYTYVTLITIYYLGYKLTTKHLWPVLMLTESVNLPEINSFRILFLLLWTIIILKVLANEYYAITYVLKDSFNLKTNTKLWWVLFPILLSLCLIVGNEVSRRVFTDYIMPKITIFSVIYIITIFLFIFFNNKHSK